MITVCRYLESVSPQVIPSFTLILSIEFSSNDHRNKITDILRIIFQKKSLIEIRWVFFQITRENENEEEEILSHLIISITGGGEERRMTHPILSFRFIPSSLSLSVSFSRPHTFLFKR